MSELQSKIEGINKQTMSAYPSVEIGVLVDPRPFIDKDLNNPLYLPLNSMSYLDYTEAQTALLDTSKMMKAVMVKSPFNSKTPEIKLNPKSVDGFFEGRTGKLQAIPENMEGKYNVTLDLINVGGNRVTPTVVGMSTNLVSVEPAMSNLTTESLSDSSTMLGAFGGFISPGLSGEQLINAESKILQDIAEEAENVNSTVDLSKTSNVSSASVLAGRTITSAATRNIGVNYSRVDSSSRNRKTGTILSQTTTSPATTKPVREP